MNNELKFNSQVCTITEQSKRLLGLGLKSETADMCIDLYYEDEPFVIHNKIDYSKQTEFLPAWTLHRLIEMLPDETDGCYSLIFDKNIIQCEEYGVDIIKYFGGSPYIYNNIIDCIEWLISKEYFNKKYLKQ